MRKLLTLAIPLLLGVGVLTALVSNPESGKQSKQSQSGVAATKSLPAVIEAAAAPATTPPTTPAAAPESTSTTLAPTTTTTAAPATTTTSRPTTTTTAYRPRSTPTTAATAPPPQPTQAAAQPQVIDCGTGTASAKANLVAGSKPSTNALTATVDNQSTKPIELDSLVVTVDYNDGSHKQFTVPVAGQRVDAQPGQAQVTFPVPNSETASSGPSSIKNFVISDFRFHTAGLPECTSH